jgi:diguanylate cyclase (GGDEF)-like protein
MRPKTVAKKKDMNDTLTAVPEQAEAVPGERQVLLITLAGSQVGAIFPLSKSKPLQLIGRDEQADVHVLDSEVSRRHAVVRYDASVDSFVINDLNSRNGTRVNGEKVNGERRLEIGDKLKVGPHTVFRVSLADETEVAYAQRMYQAALRDPLTSAFNRRYLDERLVGELAFAKRHGSPLSLLMLDLDHFKSVNDTHGHPAGDQVLQRFCHLVQSRVRSEDVVARYGGEEFAVLCRNTDEGRAAILAERLRSAVQKESFDIDGKRLAVTVSIGIAGILENEVDTPEKLVEAADAALYRAKNAGRNCWRMASS